MFGYALRTRCGLGLGVRARPAVSPVQPHCRKDLGYMSPQVVRGEEEGSIALRLTWADHRRQLRLRLGSWWRGVISCDDYDRFEHQTCIALLSSRMC